MACTLTALRGQHEKVPTFDTQRDLTARQRAHTRCPCTHGKVIGPYHSHEAHKRQIWPRGMAMNEHELTESSIGEGLRGGCSCSVRAFLGGRPLLPRQDEAYADAV